MAHLTYTSLGSGFGFTREDVMAMEPAERDYYLDRQREWRRADDKARARLL